MKVYSSPRRKKGGAVEHEGRNSKTRIAAGSLLDRLILDEEETEICTTGYVIDSIIHSIKRNLNRTLNIHAGSASSNPDLGIPDFNHSTISSLEISMHLVKAIRDRIALAEPRIRDVQVRSKSDPAAPLDLSFMITGTLRVASKDELIRIDIAMRDGHFYPS